MNNLSKNKIIIFLGWVLLIATINSMVLYMNYIEIAASIGLFIFINFVIRFVLLQILVDILKIIPPDRDSIAEFISKTGDLFGGFSYLIVFYLYLSFYQTAVSLFIGVVLSGVYFFIKKVFFSVKE